MISRKEKRKRIKQWKQGRRSQEKKEEAEYKIGKCRRVVEKERHRCREVYVCVMSLYGFYFMSLCHFMLLKLNLPAGWNKVDLLLSEVWADRFTIKHFGIRPAVTSWPLTCRRESDSSSVGGMLGGLSCSLRGVKTSSCCSLKCSETAAGRELVSLSPSVHQLPAVASGVASH